MYLKNTFTFDEETREALKKLPHGFRSVILSKLILAAARVHDQRGKSVLGPLVAGEFDIVMANGDGR